MTYESWCVITGNESPLGLLFDHGCDSMSIGLQCLIMTKCLQGGNKTPMLMALSSSIASFHFSTLVEFFVGRLHLPMFNGVSDASPLFKTLAPASQKSIIVVFQFFARNTTYFSWHQ